MNNWYKLDGKKVIRCEDGESFIHSPWNLVAKTRLKNRKVSTVFLGLDHNYLSEGDPILFETMICGIDKNGEIDGNSEFLQRYSTYEQAEDGHIEMVKRVMGGEFDDKP